MTSKELVLRQFKSDLIPEEFQIPELKENEVLVKITAAGVCGSDVHMWQGEDPRTPLPVILGHEGIGQIVSMKNPLKSVHGEDLKEGDAILWNRGRSCGKCYFCTVLKEPSLCPTRKVYGINRSCNDEPHLTGCYGEYIILVDGIDIFKVKDGVDHSVLVTACCSGATMCHGFQMVRPRIGDTVVVQGVGPLGMFGVALAKASGASQIIVIEPSQTRLDLSTHFGATTLLNSETTSAEERLEIIKDLTYGRGADFVVEAVGTADSLKEGVTLNRIGGTYLSAGFGQPLGDIAFDGFHHLVRRNIKMQGAWVSDTSHTYEAMQLIYSDPALFSKIITHRFALDDANDALKAMHSREALKAVLLP